MQADEDRNLAQAPKISGQNLKGEALFGHVRTRYRLG